MSDQIQISGPMAAAPATEEGALERTRFSAAFEGARLELRHSRSASRRRRAIANRRSAAIDPKPLDLLHEAIKVGMFAAFIAALHYGPPYYTCRQMKNAGMFFNGTTVGSCMQERIGATSWKFW